MRFPDCLLPGDTIAICSPAGSVDPSLFDPAIATLRRRGFNVKEMPHARGRHGSYSGSRSERLADLADALLDPNVKAVICGRGGYGAVHLLDDIYEIAGAPAPKWLIGFSDISALHGAMHARGIASVHASMLRSLADSGAEAETDMLFAMLRGEPMRYAWPSHSLNRPGKAEGMLVGGNLSVLSALIGTRYDLLRPSSVLFIEDINEPVYKLERMLWQLRLSGVLGSLRGLIVGQFTGTRADANHSSAYEMVADMTAPYSYPVAFDAPIGHSGRNIPLMIGRRHRLLVGAGSDPLLLHAVEVGGGSAAQF